MIRFRNALPSALVPLVVSWAAAAAFPLLPQFSKWHTLPPEVPFLLTPGAAGDHVRSSVYFFLVVLAAALLCVLPLEISKYVAAKRYGSRLLYAAFGLQQLVLIADMIRSYAWDWWLFLLSMSGLRPLHPHSWMETHFSTIGRWPWPSAVTAAVLVCAVLWRSRRSPSPAS